MYVLDMTYTVNTPQIIQTVGYKSQDICGDLTSVDIVLPWLNTMHLSLNSFQISVYSSTNMDAGIHNVPVKICRTHDLSLCHVLNFKVTIIEEPCLSNLSGLAVSNFSTFLQSTKYELYSFVPPSESLAGACGPIMYRIEPAADFITLDPSTSQIGILPSLPSPNWLGLPSPNWLGSTQFTLHAYYPDYPSASPLTTKFILDVID